MCLNAQDTGNVKQEYTLFLLLLQIFIKKLKKLLWIKQKPFNKFKPGVKVFQDSNFNSSQSRFSRDIYFFKGLRFKKKRS